MNFVYIGCCESHDAQTFPFSTTSLHKSRYKNSTLLLVCFSSGQYDVLFKNYTSQYFFFPSETNPSDESYQKYLHERYVKMIRYGVPTTCSTVGNQKKNVSPLQFLFPTIHCRQTFEGDGLVLKCFKLLLVYRCALY